MFKMSDYISNIENHVRLYNRVHNDRNCDSNVRSFDWSNTNMLRADENVRDREDILGQYIRTTRRNQENGCLKRISSGNNGCIHLESTHASDFRELERVSANLIQLLHEAKHKSTMVADAHVLVKMGRLQAINEQILNLERVQGDLNYIPSRRARTTPIDTFCNNGRVVCSTCSSENTTDSTNKIGASFADLLSDSSFDKSDKDLQRKDPQNKMVNKRRSVVNNIITELGCLPDEKDRYSSRKKKGSIIKESIDCIKTLKKDHERIKRLQDKIDDTDRELKNLSQCVEQLETRSLTHLANNDRCEYQLSNEHTTGCDIVSPTETSRNVQEYCPDLLPTVSEIQSCNHAYDDLTMIQ